MSDQDIANIIIAAWLALSLILSCFACHLLDKYYYPGHAERRNKKLIDELEKWRWKQGKIELLRKFKAVDKNTPYVKGEFHSEVNDKLKFIPAVKQDEKIITKPRCRYDYKLNKWVLKSISFTGCSVKDIEPFLQSHGIIMAEDKK